MFYEIHDDKVVLARFLHPHTPQGIYSICKIKKLPKAKHYLACYSQEEQEKSYIKMKLKKGNYSEKERIKILKAFDKPNTKLWLWPCG